MICMHFTYNNDKSITIHAYISNQETLPINLSHIEYKSIDKIPNPRIRCS